MSALIMNSATGAELLVVRSGFARAGRMASHVPRVRSVMLDSGVMIINASHSLLMELGAFIVISVAMMSCVTIEFVRRLCLLKMALRLRTPIRITLSYARLFMLLKSMVKVIAQQVQC